MDTTHQKVDMQTGLVSICMATWNREQYISQAIASVQKQSYEDWELIVIDDGSTDNTAHVLASLADKDSRIKLFRHERNRGISVARNRALEEARGEFLAVLDSDDLWSDPAKLLKQVAHLRNNPTVVMVGTQAHVIDRDGQTKSRILNPTDDASIRQSMLALNPFVHSSVVMRTVSVVNLGGYDEDLVVLEDYDLWCRLGSEGKLANLSDLATSYRDHGGGITKERRRQSFVAALTLINTYKNAYPGYWRAWLRRVIRYRAYLALSFLGLVQ